MDLSTFYKLTYGLYIVSSKKGAKDCGCVINTMQQVTSDPPKISVTVNKENYTCQAILDSGLFTGVVFNENVDMDMLRTFGFASSEDTDKFSSYNHKTDLNGIKYVTEGIGGRFSCKVVDQLDVGTHITFVGEVTDCEVMSQDPVMTYAYYHKVKNGKTPPKAPSYKGEEESAQVGAHTFKCSVCGYEHHTDQDYLEDGFKCPVCGVDKDKFRKIK